MSRWFLYPLTLWLLTLLPLAMLQLWALRRWRRHALEKLGSLPLVQRLILVRDRRRRWQAICLLAGLALLIVGLAGPQWGRAGDHETALGRDLVVVLDLSRSMLAEQPSRLVRAQRALSDLCDTLQQRGGHRLALVVFAAHPRLVFPLTPDYDHFRAALAQQDADYPPLLLRPNPELGETSGTRIGEALRLAVLTHDPAFQGFQDILLVSDGDDPARDGEWSEGADAARVANIPVHAVGVGNPATSSSIPTRDGPLRQEGTIVKTRLEEEPLREIAGRTHGTYIPVRTQNLPLGRLVREFLETRRERPEGAGSAILYRLRYEWLLLPALMLLAGSLSIDERARRREIRIAPAGLVALLLPTAVLLVGAAPPEPIDVQLRQGNAAFARGNYAEALKFYAQAEERATDPGLVAFNKAAALYRLERYREAEEHYRRCLDDPQAPANRKVRGLYDLGNSLLQQAREDDVDLLEQAVRAYEACLDQVGAAPELRGDAEHNLELAKLLWLKAKATPKGRNRPDEEGKNDGPKKKQKNPEGASKDPENKGNTKNSGTKSDQKPAKNGAKPLEATESRPGKGTRGVLPDTDQLVPLSPEDTLGYLEGVARRVERQRQESREQGPLPGAGSKTGDGMGIEN